MNGRSIRCRVVLISVFILAVSACNRSAQKNDLSVSEALQETAPAADQPVAEASPVQQEASGEERVKEMLCSVSGDDTQGSGQFNMTRGMNPSGIPNIDVIYKKSQEYGFDWRLIAASMESKQAEIREENLETHEVEEMVEAGIKHLTELVDGVQLASSSESDGRELDGWELLLLALAAQEMGLDQLKEHLTQSSKPMGWESVCKKLPIQTVSNVVKVYRKYDQYRSMYFRNLNLHLAEPQDESDPSRYRELPEGKRSVNILELLKIKKPSHKKKPKTPEEEEKPYVAEGEKPATSTESETAEDETSEGTDLDTESPPTPPRNIKYPYYFVREEAHCDPSKWRFQSRHNIENGLRKYFREICEESRRRNIDWRFTAAIIQQESTFNPRARNLSSGARGLMQIVPKDAGKDYRNAHGINQAQLNTMLSDPRGNIRVGTWYFRHVLDWVLSGSVGLYSGKTLHDSFLIALASYNAGAGHVADAQAIASREARRGNRDFVAGPRNIVAVATGLIYLQTRRDYIKNSKHGYVEGATQTLPYIVEIFKHYNWLLANYPLGHQSLTAAGATQSFGNRGQGGGS